MGFPRLLVLKCLLVLQIVMTALIYALHQITHWKFKSSANSANICYRGPETLHQTLHFLSRNLLWKLLHIHKLNMTVDNFGSVPFFAGLSRSVWGFSWGPTYLRVSAKKKDCCWPSTRKWPSWSRRSNITSVRPEKPYLRRQYFSRACNDKSSTKVLHRNVITLKCWC